MIEDTSFLATSLPSDLDLAIKHPLDQVLGTVLTLSGIDRETNHQEASSLASTPMSYYQVNIGRHISRP